MSEPDATDSEPIGSMAEEAYKLLRSVTGDNSGETAHVCTATWCPVCQVVGYFRDNPEVLAQVSASAAAAIRTLRDAVVTSANSGTNT